MVHGRVESLGTPGSAYSNGLSNEQHSLSAAGGTALRGSLSYLNKSLRSVKATLAHGITASYESLVADSSLTDRIERVGFAVIGTPDGDQHVMVATYANGWQLWDIGDPNTVREVLSRRDGPVRCVQVLPNCEYDASNPLAGQGPIVAVAAGLGTMSVAARESSSNGKVRFYSLHHNEYMHELCFSSPVVSLRCNAATARGGGLLVVALASGQLHVYSLATLRHEFSAMALPRPMPPQQQPAVAAAGGTAGAANGSGPGSVTPTAEAKDVPVALGARWIAYASNQPCDSTADAAPAHGAPSRKGDDAGNGVSAAAWTVATHSGKQIKALSAAGYRYLAGQYDAWRSSPPSSSSPPSYGEGLGGTNGYAVSPGAHGPAASGGSGDGSSSAGGGGDGIHVAGIVMVRDLATRQVVAHFRAHSHHLAALQWDPSGQLLATASESGQTVNVFRILPRIGGGNGGSGCSGFAQHLFRLSRGVTPASIADLSFSSQSDWVTVSSSHGTTHLFRLAQPETAAWGGMALAGAGASRSHAASAHWSSSFPAAALRQPYGLYQQQQDSYPGEHQPFQAVVCRLPAFGQLPGGPILLKAVARLRSGGVVPNTLQGAAASSSAGLVASLGAASPGGTAATFLTLPPPPPSAALQQQHGAAQSQRQCWRTWGETLCTAGSRGKLAYYAIRVAVPASCGSPRGGALPSPPPALGPLAAAGGFSEQQLPSVEVEAVQAWEVARKKTWPERDAERRPASPSAQLGTGPMHRPPSWPGGERELWMAQCEIVTHAAPRGASLWDDPRFRLKGESAPHTQQPGGPGPASGDASGTA